MFDFLMRNLKLKKLQFFTQITEIEVEEHELKPGSACSLLGLHQIRQQQWLP